MAIGYDEGSIVIKLGREEPAMSMDNNGKMIFARHADLQQANIKALGGEMGDIQVRIDRYWRIWYWYGGLLFTAII